MQAFDHLTVARCRRRAAALAALRQFFAAQEFVEVDTPVVLRAPAPELNIEPPVVELPAAMGLPPQRRFLQASPELGMKRLLAAGLPRIYQVAPTFRAGDHSPLHRQEFRLLEWYRRDGTLAQLQADCEALCTAMQRVTAAQAPGAATTAAARAWAAGAPFLRWSLPELFARHVGSSLLECVGTVSDPLALPPGDVAALRRALQRAAVPFAADDSWEDLFHRAFMQCIEPQLVAAPRPVIVSDFPAPLAALARLSPADPRVAERFELYVGGVELANGYGELTCARTQRARFVAERARRGAAGKVMAPLCEAFLAALPQLPAAAGIALGLDRMLMLMWKEADLGATTCLPTEEDAV